MAGDQVLKGLPLLLHNVSLALRSNTACYETGFRETLVFALDLKK